MTSGNSAVVSRLLAECHRGPAMVLQILRGVQLAQNGIRDADVEIIADLVSSPAPTWTERLAAASRRGIFVTRARG